MQNISEQLSEIVQKMNELVIKAKELEEVKDNNQVQLSTCNVGDVVKIADHNFIVCEVDEDKACLLCKDLWAEDETFGDSRDYKKSNIRKICEEQIQPLIEQAVGAENLIENEVDLTSLIGINEFGSLKCKVRPSTFDEFQKYGDLVVNEDLPDWWWTCTPWGTEKRGYNRSIAVVSSSGRIIRYFCYDYHGVRPFCILKSNIFVSKEE